MRTSIYTSLLLLLFTLAGCSGSDVYRGDWKAMDRSGNKSDISFDAKNFTMKSTEGTTENYGYSQIGIEIQNSIRRYKIKLQDGRVFAVSFPLPNNTSKGIISLETGEALYTIGRDEYVEFSELLTF